MFNFSRLQLIMKFVPSCANHAVQWLQSWMSLSAEGMHVFFYACILLTDASFGVACAQMARLSFAIGGAAPLARRAADSMLSSGPETPRLNGVVTEKAGAATRQVIPQTPSLCQTSVI